MDKSVLKFICDSDRGFTCLGDVRWCGINSSNPIFLLPFKLAKESKATVSVESIFCKKKNLQAIYNFAKNV